jgi:putative tryptophan/tyrosine transport system substrate-binding protein
MRRRDFITLIGAGVTAWPLGTRAQQNASLRHVSVMLTASETDPDAVSRAEAFRQAMKQLGWIEGRTLQLDFRWSVADSERIRAVTSELARRAPDVVVPEGAGLAAPMLQASRTIPVVFVLVADPVGAGLVESLAHPGGNATGFTAIDYSFASKWLELLKELAPGVTRVGVLRDPNISVGIGLFSAIQSAAPSAGVEVDPVSVGDAAATERNIAAFAHGPHDGLIVTPSPQANAQRDSIIASAVKLKLPAVYYSRPFVAAGGLAAYATSISEEYRLAAGYVDRILKGAKPADLPVQNPTKYELIVNLKTAKALGINLPAAVITRADEVIE